MPAKATPVAEMTDGQLADAHLGHTFAKMRAAEKLKEIELELDRRGLVAAQGDRGFVSRQLSDVGLIDIKRLRADLGDAICRDYAIGDGQFWRSKARFAEVKA